MAIKNKPEFYFFALAATGEGISGGDRIFIELSRQWSKKNKINIITSLAGAKMCARQNLLGNYLHIMQKGFISLENIFVIDYLVKILLGVHLGLTLKLQNTKAVYVYSASEFWMDSLPAFLLKLRYPSIKWIAAWYQTAPNPLQGYTVSKRQNTYKLSAFLFWLMQLPIKPLITNFADFVLINNQNERKYFPSLDKKNKAIVLIGAVDVEGIKKWIKSHRSFSKKYQAVFQGRFHPQKGVEELIDIWKLVVSTVPNAKLAMIGDGPLMSRVKQKIAKAGLTKNIKLFGYLFDGDKKYKVFSQSQVVVHPAFFDSGGMASAEAMIFGLPCVGFDLPAYKSYYPSGMVKVAAGSIESFANQIIKLLQDEGNRKRLGREASNMIEENWSWSKRAEQIYNKITI